jgi:N-acetyltransferase
MKRRRVSIPLHKDAYESVPSSDSLTSDAAAFSDQNLPPSTPPSSPPYLANSPKPIPLDLQPTSVATDETVPASNSNIIPKKPLVQMQLNFGQSMQKKCKECGMEYVPSAPEDAALHKKYHAQNTNGVTMERDFLTKVKSERGLWSGPHGAFIVSLSGSRDPKHWLKKARAVFDMATSDLGAVDIPDEKLWGQRASATQARNKMTPEKKQGDTEEEGDRDRYKLYLYVDNGKCVGLCLAEGIDSAFTVLEPEDSADGAERERTTHQADSVSRGDSPLCISEESEPAVIGISRIWTSRGARKKGIAKALLKCTAKTFGPEPTPKDLVAFSQPTEMGTALARRWFGREHGWHVYVD